MKNQVFLSSGLILLLLSNSSFSMKPEQGNNSCVNPPAYQEREEARLLHPRVAQKYIDGLAIAREVIDSVLREERNRATAAEEYHDEKTYHLNHFHIPMYLLKGSHGNGKSKVAQAIASLLDRKLTIVDFFRFNLENPGHFIPVEDRLAPIFSQNDEPRVVVLEDIEKLSSYHCKNNDIIYCEENNEILELRPFLQEVEIQEEHMALSDVEKQDKNWMKSKFVVLATTSCLKRIPYELLEFFDIVKIKHPNLARRSTILTNLLEAEDYTIDISMCTPEVIEELAKKTDGFSIRELQKFIRTANFYASARPGDGKAPLEQKDLDKAFEEVYPYTRIGAAQIQARKETAEAEAARRKTATEEAQRRVAEEKEETKKWRLWPIF